MENQIDSYTARDMQATAVGIVEGDAFLWGMLMANMRQPAPVEEPTHFYGSSNIDYSQDGEAAQ